MRETNFYKILEIRTSKADWTGVVLFYNWIADNWIVGKHWETMHG